MKRWTVVWLVVATALAGAQSVRAQGFSVGARAWQAHWELDSETFGTMDMGDELFILGYFGYHEGPGNLILQYGHGDGWDLDVTRDEFSAAGTLTSAELIPPAIANTGLAFRYTNYDGGSVDWYYAGLEWLLGAVVPLGNTGLALSASGSVGWYAWSISGSGGSGSDDGSVLGWTADGGVSYTLETVQFSLGYRQQVAERDGSFEGDSFAGMYIGAGCVL